MSMKLYEISQEYVEILDNLYDEEGNVNQQALVRLEENKNAMEKKAIAVASFIKNMEAEKDAIEIAKKAMAEREKRYKTRIEDLKGYLQINMEKRGISKITCPYFEIKLKKCPVSVDIYDESQIPEEYKRVKTETAPDKIKIKEEMMVGVIIPGANLKQNMALEIR